MAMTCHLDAVTAEQALCFGTVDFDARPQQTKRLLSAISKKRFIVFPHHIFLLCDSRFK